MNLQFTGVKETNLRLVFSEIVLGGPVGRTDIAKATGLASATVSRMTRTLVERDLIVETETVASPDRPGRRNVLLDVCPTGGYIIGLSVNAFEQIVSIANIKNEVVAYRSLSLIPQLSSEESLKIIATAIEEMILEHNIDRDKILGIAAAVTGDVEDGTGIIRSAPVIGWVNVDLAGYMKKYLGFNVHLENLPSAVNLAEKNFGITRGEKNVVLVNIALSIGVSLLLENNLVQSSAGLHGMLGGLPLFEGPAGSTCSAERSAAGWALILSDGGDKEKEYASIPGKQLSLILSGEQQDLELQKTLYSIGHNGGRLLELVAGIMQPNVIVVSGPMARCKSYMDAVRDYLKSSPVFGKGDMRLLVSHMSANEATRSLALQRFLIG